MSKTEFGIYTGVRIFKDDKEVEYKTDIAFYLGDVSNWEEYPFDIFREDKPKIFVELPRSTYILVESFDRFNNIMKRYNQTRVSSFNN
jgi:hypothetical protein